MLLVSFIFPRQLPNAKLAPCVSLGILDLGVDGSIFYKAAISAQMKAMH